MAINEIITNGLGCAEQDLPETSAVFEHLKHAGISPERLSGPGVLRCARLAIREEFAHHHIGKRDAVELYNRVHDSLDAHQTTSAELIQY